MNVKCWILLVLSVVFFGSCSSTKKVVYLQGIEDMPSDSMPVMYYDARVKPKDLLIITVSSFNPEISKPFNLATSVGEAGSDDGSLKNYLVDSDGFIDFPVLGKIEVAGMTKGEIENQLKERLSIYLKEPPLVMVRMVNYKFTVLGEVGSPGVYVASNERVNIFEAIAQAGDMTIQGRRDNVKLIREHVNGKKEVAVLDFRDPNIINSPYYYLQQNDMIYVEPNRQRAGDRVNGGAFSKFTSVFSFILSLATLGLTVGLTIYNGGE
jgi:polysaccharide export outer membrane protein